jgi:amidase
MTPPIKATELPPPNASRDDHIDRALNMISNTAPFDITHDPAMAIPCGMADGLPVSLMLIGRHFDEPSIYHAAFAFERLGDWKMM